MLVRYAAVVLALLGCVLAASPAAQRPGAPAGPPRLVVLIVVDQMRADYVDRFRADWSSGLHRLLAEGAWFPDAGFPYLTTVTCPGHATIATGAFPRTHGIFQNAWYDRERRRVVTCTEDPEVDAVAYDGDIDGGGESSVRLRLPTLADEMRRQKRARVVTLSLKPRSAIMLAGGGGEAVTWLNTELDGWETSTQFSSRMVPAVKAFLDANPVAGDFGRVWTRLLPLARYREPDAAAGEAPPRGWTPLFPHPLTGDEGKPDARFHTQWERSPFASEYLARLAVTLTEALELGRGDRTDVLGVSFSSPDLVGHAFGPNSQEVRDVYAHLDQTIGTLLERLDDLVGRGGYLVALSADHGVSTLPEQLRQAGQDAGRIGTAALTTEIERAAQIAGRTRYVARVYGNDVYFEPGMYERLRRRPAAIEALVASIERQPGIARVLQREEVLNGSSSADPAVRAAALSYVEGLSGDLVLIVKPGWVFTGTGTTHGTMNPYDQRVPIVIAGPGVTPGQYRGAATPADIAPTLARLVGITMPRAEGQVLTDALAPAVRTR